MKLKTGDQVIVTVGKDKSQKGKVQRVFPQQNKVLIEGINKYKKHVKPQGQGKPGGILEKERPIDISKLALLCPGCKQQTRIGYEILKSGDKVRICRKCKKEI